MPNYDRTRLRQILISRFSESEMQDLCFDLEIDYESLAGESKRGKARELIAYLERHSRLSDLVQIGAQLRSDIDWSEALGGAEAAAAPYRPSPTDHLRRREIAFEVEVGDVTTFGADVVALKFAQGLHGADKAVASVLGVHAGDIMELLPILGRYELLPGRGRLGAKHALFLNVGDMYSFGYEEIRWFAAEVLRALASAAPSTRHLAMTIHGVGYGLDEAETLRSQLAGCLDAFDLGGYPEALERITIVDRNPGRAQRLRIILNDAIPGNAVALPETTEPQDHSEAIELSPLTSNVGRESASKPHVFVAMPFAEEMEDVYYYGIQAPVNAAGYLCERVDLKPFTGDILDRIKLRIESASLVVADLTTANPNVFLEVGYAWGKGRPTILLVRDPDELPFDVRGQRCLVYGKIRELEEALAKELKGLRGSIN